MQTAWKKMMLFASASAVVLAAMWNLFRNSPALSQDRNKDNPDKFCLWLTNSAYTYTFTYDPRAADKWLFQTGGPATTNRP